jgi:hypothetical protein
MKLISWFSVVILSIALAYIGFIKKFSLLDFLGSAILIFISIYIILRYLLSIILGVENKPLVQLNLRYLYLPVFYSINITLLGYTIDILISLPTSRTIVIYILSMVSPIAIVYIVNKFFGFKGLRILLMISIFILGSLYLLGYVKDFSIF